MFSCDFFCGAPSTGRHSAHPGCAHRAGKQTSPGSAHVERSASCSPTSWPPWLLVVCGLRALGLTSFVALQEVGAPFNLGKKPLGPDQLATAGAHKQGSTRLTVRAPEVCANSTHKYKRGPPAATCARLALASPPGFSGFSAQQQKAAQVSRFCLFPRQQPRREQEVAHHGARLLRLVPCVLRAKWRCSEHPLLHSCCCC